MPVATQYRVFLGIHPMHGEGPDLYVSNFPDDQIDAVNAYASKIVAFLGIVPGPYEVVVELVPARGSEK